MHPAARPVNVTRVMIGKRLSIAATVLAVICIARLALTGRVFGVGPLSIALQVGAGLLMLWARITFGKRSFHAAANTTHGELVTRGPYAVVRNPIYLAVIVFVFAAAGARLDAEAVMLALGIAACMLVRIFAEERFLRATYPEYADYAKRVARLVPFVF